jgi:hypothetical protein
MVTIDISEALAERLHDAARKRNTPVEELIETLLGQLEEDEADQPLQAPPGTLAALAESARRANIRTGETDVAERSREILEQEWGEHLTRWMTEEERDTDG